MTRSVAWVCAAAGRRRRPVQHSGSVTGFKFRPRRHGVDLLRREADLPLAGRTPSLGSDIDPRDQVVEPGPARRRTAAVSHGSPTFAQSRCAVPHCPRRVKSAGDTTTIMPFHRDIDFRFKQRKILKNFFYHAKILMETIFKNNVESTQSCSHGR